MDFDQRTHERQILSCHGQHKQLIHELETTHYHLAHAPHHLCPAKALFNEPTLGSGKGIAHADGNGIVTAEEANVCTGSGTACHRRKLTFTPT